MTYRNFRKNIHSANGEDGVIEQLFKDLNIKSGLVCEFGAWDGFLSSNTANLWKNENFSALLIESCGNRYGSLVENTKDYDVQTMQVGVAKNSSDENSIDNLLSKCQYDTSEDNFALMSIDIDSYDYYVFESLQKHKPKVLIVEVSSGYQPHEEFISEDKSCSLLSLSKLAGDKGYKPVIHIGNVIMVRDDLSHMLPDYDYSLKAIYTSPKELLEYEKGN